MGRQIRRDALHCAILYNKKSAWLNDGRFVIPKDGHRIDPDAFYKMVPPFDSQSVAKLPGDQKGVFVPFANAYGS